MVTTPSIVRAACWLASAGLHAAAFVAASHAPPFTGPANRDSLEPLAIDVAPGPGPEASEGSAAPARAQSASFVPQSTHTHVYPVPADHDVHPHDPSLVHMPFAFPPPPQAETVLDAPHAPARFAMKVTSGPDVPAAASSARSDEDPEPGSDSAPLPETRVSSPARLATAISPAYPAEARAQGVEADVVLAIVVASTGEVVNAHVLKTTGFGLDQAALRAVRTARFIPAMLDGRRVAVRMRWTMSFRLR